jgi:hypothetical protein
MLEIGQSAGNPQKGDPQRLYARAFASRRRERMELSPDWVVGFVDGEGCFHVSVNENPKTKLGYQVIPEFVVVQHQRDIQVLYALKSFFKCGVVRKNNGDRWCYRVRKLACLKAICEFFVKHPLKTKKNVDRIRFCRIVGYMLEGRHLSVEGLLEIIDVALRMNTQQREALLRIKKDLEAKVRYSPPLGESQGER